jgi:hypothetical protein
VRWAVNIPVTKVLSNLSLTQPLGMQEEFGDVARLFTLDEPMLKKVFYPL